MPIFIDKAYTAAEKAAFKAGVDAAREIIALQIPVLTPTEEKKLMSAHRERAEFLPASYNEASTHPNIMTDAYNHSHHNTSNNLVTDYQEMIDYVDSKLVQPLLMSKYVSGDQATRAGVQVLNATHERSRTDASFVAIWKNLSKLYMKKSIKAPAPPKP